MFQQARPTQGGQPGYDLHYGRGRPQRGRGGYRGRGRGYGQRDLMEDLLPNPLQTLEIPQVSDAEANVAITDVRYLGSYNYVVNDEWLDMIVPGAIFIRRLHCRA